MRYMLSRRAVFPLKDERIYRIISGSVLKYASDVDGRVIGISLVSSGGYVISRPSSFSDFFVKALSQVEMEVVSIKEVDVEDIICQHLLIEELSLIKSKRFSEKQDYPIEECRLPLFHRWARANLPATFLTSEIIGSLLGTTKSTIIRHTKKLWKS